jgi:hypothetical protein
LGLSWITQKRGKSENRLCWLMACGCGGFIWPLGACGGVGLATVRSARTDTEATPAGLSAYIGQCISAGAAQQLGDKRSRKAMKPN